MIKSVISAYRPLYLASLLSIFSIVLCAPVQAKTIESAISGMDKTSGFIDIYINPKTREVYGLLPVDSDPDDDALLRAIYAARLRSGLGSNPVGLDRGWGDSGSVIALKRFGDKVIVEVENWSYRTNGRSRMEDQAVDESFADSFIAALDIKAEENGRVLVDLTDFLNRDALGLVQYLKDAGQGSFSLSKDLTFIDTKNSFAFPDNVEFDVFLTLASSDPGDEVSTTSATGNDVTLVQHHSISRLPDGGFTPRFSDPRMGAMENVYYDYSAPLSGQIERRLARRHRLKKDVNGQVIEPIVFYIDSGAPEPVRSALVEGASWWAQAFDAAGYPGGYKVELLPEDVHPLDIRYNVVQWVHRQTRGWSYGGGIVDPRTGEILKGHVNLGSLRVRQDRMIFEGLAGTSKTGTGSDDDPIELSLDRIRQLAAHEVGHSLGFAHNFAASTFDKSSVMDYPAPDVRLSEEGLDFSNAYGKGIGAWDMFAAKMIYGNLTPVERDRAYEQASKDGLVYVADPQARGIGTAHPKGAIWDNGSDPIAALAETLKVRRYALERFDRTRLMAGQPISDLSKVIVPIYLYHRYEVAAVGKLIGGMEYGYGVVEEGAPEAKIVDPKLQKQAISAVLDTLDPAIYDLPDATLNLLSPGILTYTFADSPREKFKDSAGGAFDIISAADTAAAHSFDVLLHPQRAARMIEFHRRSRKNPGFADLLSSVRRKVMRTNGKDRLKALSHTIQRRYAYSLMDLIDDAQSTPAVKSAARHGLKLVHRDFLKRRDATARFMAAEIDRFLSRPDKPADAIVQENTLPPGSPIGADAYETCWFCDVQ